MAAIWLYLVFRTFDIYRHGRSIWNLSTELPKHRNMAEAQETKATTAQTKNATKKNPQPPKIVIGWSEYLDFPDWHIEGLLAKVDTGARTSALHVEDLEVVGGNLVQFNVITGRKHADSDVRVIAPILKWARVRSSTGHYTERCFVRTTVRIGSVTKDIELSLVSRERMIYRMLLGRKALERDFLVDVARRRILGKKPRRGSP